MLSENISMLLLSNASKCIFIKFPADQQNEIHLMSVPKYIFHSI